MKLKISPLLINKFVPKMNVVRFKGAKDFVPLVYEKAGNIEDAKMFALKNFGIEQLNGTKLSDYNRVNSICTKVYNLTEGQAKFVKNIAIKEQKGIVKYDGEYGDGKITMVDTPFFECSFVHELGHYNHELFSQNYEKMGKISEIKEDMLYPDYTFYNRFMQNQHDLKTIRTYLGSYATASPAEFVAEMFRAIVSGKNLPKHLFDVYRQYEGPFADILLQKYALKSKVI